MRLQEQGIIDYADKVDGILPDFPYLVSRMGVTEWELIQSNALPKDCCSL
ncbi:UNVERIFIED_CONTAM: hypothetical protein ABID98_002330 [Brevibacillus sp. OAP136]